MICVSTQAESLSLDTEVIIMCNSMLCIALFKCMATFTSAIQQRLCMRITIMTFQHSYFMHMAETESASEVSSA